MRILLIAEAANPEWVSVPLEGWSHSRAIAKIASAHVVTQIRNRQAFLRAEQREAVDFTVIDSERIAAAIWKISKLVRGGANKGWTTVAALSSISYYYFEHLVWKQFGDRIRSGEFDVVHRLTPLTPTTPSLIAKKCRRAGVPFVMGPLNGGVPWPRGFDGARRKEREWLSYVRSAYKFLPGYASCRRNAAAILVGSNDTLAQMPSRYHRKCFYIQENAIDPARFTRTRERAGSGPLRAVFVGRLVPYKGADMLLDAAQPLIKAGRIRIEIIGDGPQRGELESQADRLQIADGVAFHGWIPHERLQDTLVHADVFAFPSIREFGGGAVVEAMAIGLVPIVINYGGPGEIVTDSTGIRLPIGPREQIVSALHAALLRLCNAPDELELLSHAARKRANERFTWDAKARDVLSVYDWVLGGAPQPTLELKSQLS